MTKSNIRKRHLKLVFFGSSDEGDDESVASDKNQDIINLIQFLNRDKTLAKVSIYTGGYGGTMNMIAECFQNYLDSEINKEIVGVVSEIYGTKEENDGLSIENPNRISEHNHRLIWTNSLQERTEILIESAPNIIVLPGKQGTLIEFLLADENARLTYNTNKTITKHFFLDEFWRDTLFQSDFIRKSYYENSEEKPKQHFFISGDSDCWSNFIYDFDEKDLISYNDIHTSGNTNLKSLYTRISKKLEGKVNWKYCIEGLDFAYTIKTGDKIEESKFSNIGNKDYNQSTEEFLKGQSIIRSYIEDNLVSYYVYSNYKNDNNPTVKKLEFSDPKDIPLNALRNKKIRFEDWADYLRTKEIGSSTIFLFEKFETNSLVINSGYEMYYSLFVTLNVNVTPKIFDFIKSTLKEFLFRVSNSKSIEIFQRKEKSLHNTSLKSSLAAVMSRNMSHNIGSHVLNKLSSAAAINDFFKLGSSKRFVKGIEIDNDDPSKTRKKFRFPNPELSKNPDDELRNLRQIEEDSNIDISIDEYNKILKDHPDYLERFRFSTFEKEKDIYKLSPYFVDVNNNTTKEELARVFNDYLKKRMDFVADVATSNKALLNSNKYLFADIFRGFERNLLLLHNISGKEDKFTYQFQFQYCYGSRVEKDNLITHNYYHYKEDEKNGKLIFDLDDNGIPKKNNNFIDPIVAVPNDVLGSQAFYIILENIIRNTAKHSGSGNVIFTIKVEDFKEDDFYRVTVFDNAPHKNIKKLVVDRNVSIAQDVLDENNQIRTSGWGTIEIKLAACYLSGLDMLEMDNKIYWPIGYPKYDEIRNENDDRDSDEAITKAKESYIKFLKEKQSEKFTIDVEGLKKALDVTDCAKNLTRTIDKEKKDNNEVVRYPIVQAVDGNEKDKNSGFGYSFLMKKPKKLLIIDEREHLKLKTTDEKGNVTSHKDNVIALKRLGIDIIKAPNRDSIYNHQFMIIVGDENCKHYGGWFNLPQERCFYSHETKKYRYFNSFKKKKPTENKFYYEFQFVGEELDEKKSLLEIMTVSDFSLAKVLHPLKKLAYQNMELNLVPLIIPSGDLNTQSLGKLKLNSENWLSDNNFITGDDYDYGEFIQATFEHHGSQDRDDFISDKNFYSEVYGSVTPLGLYLQSLNEQIENNSTLLDDIKSENQFFFTKGVNSKIMVVDERIQNVLHENGASVEASEHIKNSYSLENYWLFKKSNIIVPNQNEVLNYEKTSGKINLNESNLESQKPLFLDYLKDKSLDLDFLIIHFGILESFRNKNLNQNVSQVLQEVENSIVNENCKLIITSGRGHTPDIKKLDRYFIAYSTISNLLLDPNNRSKSHLTYTLSQLRKK